MTEVKLPHIAEGVANATVSYWHRAVGDDVKEGDDLVEMVTDKAAFNVPSPVSGIIREICIQEGAEAAVGQVIAKIE